MIGALDIGVSGVWICLYYLLWFWDQNKCKKKEIGLCCRAWENICQNLHSTCKSINTQIWSKYRHRFYTFTVSHGQTWNSYLTSGVACTFKHTGLKQGSNVLQILAETRERNSLKDKGPRKLYWKLHQKAVTWTGQRGWSQTAQPWQGI